MSVSERVKDLLSQHRPNDHLIEILAMTLAREIDRLREELRDHADPDLVGSHYRGDPQ